jgi:predicted glycosyltransferase
VLAAQLIPYVDVTVGSGGTICRETALMGIPTINFHFWDVIAKYLFNKNFPIQCLRSTEKIIKIARNILKKPEKYKVNSRRAIEKLENPVPITVQYIERLLKEHVRSVK